MLRTAIFTTLATIGLASATHAADVRQFPQVAPSYRPGQVVTPPTYLQSVYAIQVRRFYFEPWRTYTLTRNHAQAHSLVNYFRFYGVQARVVHL